MSVRRCIHWEARGWLTKDDVFNTKTLPQVAKELEKRRMKAEG